MENTKSAPSTTPSTTTPIYLIHNRLDLSTWSFIFSRFILVQDHLDLTKRSFWRLFWYMIVYICLDDHLFFQDSLVYDRLDLAKQFSQDSFVHMIVWIWLSQFKLFFKRFDRLDLTIFCTRLFRFDYFLYVIV